jgi:putative CocE/NonD family hydrolase
MKKTLTVVFIVFFNLVSAQEYEWKPISGDILIGIEISARKLAKEIIANYNSEDEETPFDDLFRLHIAINEYKKSTAYLDSLSNFYKKQYPEVGNVIGIHYRVNNEANILLQKEDKTYEEVFNKAFQNITKNLTTSERGYLTYYFTDDLATRRQKLFVFVERLNKKGTISRKDAIEFVRNYVTFKTYTDLQGFAKPQIKAMDDKYYIIQDSLLVKTSKDKRVSSIVVRKKSSKDKLPTILMFSIYPSDYDLVYAKEAADAGYVGVIAHTRGKKNSVSTTNPFEYDSYDVNKVIDWISKQPWSDGQVGMYGGSYLGFTQWAATKNTHSALKTIVPQVSVGTGIDYPMHNGVFMSYMLRWLHYVTNNKMIDDEVFEDDEKWKTLYSEWYKSGKSFRTLDSIEGKPNPIFQRWLDHPNFDNYWKNMTVSGKQFSKIDIPVLTFTGYYDDDQIGALYYYKEHHKYHKNPNHHLVIGPYNHAGAQGYPDSELKGYKLDSVANIPINKITFKWFDYILKDSIKPSFLKNKVNIQVMGKNKWRHVNSLKDISNDTIKFYLDNTLKNGSYKLTKDIQHKNEYIRYQMDFKDRSDYEKDFDHEEFKIVDSTLTYGKQIVFATEPFKTNFELNGQFIGNLSLITNKKDLDIRILLYELKPNGTYFNLSNYLARASYTENREKRKLLSPGKKQEIRIKNTFFTSKSISVGSKLIVLLSINNNPSWQVNYGSGKDVSEESIQDAGEPLEVKWYTDSYLKFPIFSEIKSE